MESSDGRVYRRLARALRVGLSVSLVLLASGLVLGLAAGSPAAEGPAAHASGLVLAGVAVLLALPVVQAVLAAFTYWSQGDRGFGLAAFGLVVIQCLALLAARL
ncbi:MAG TPA: hypothetical protein DHW14_07350 [Clostridiales bacterium]|nr:hypothetical protein [Clostridiales bacterium]